jgi:hypothetical protein
MSKYIAPLLALLLWQPIESARADYSVSIVHYRCRSDQNRLEIWHQMLDNEPGSFFDKPNAGAYDPNTLGERDKESTEHRPSRRSPIRKTCHIGGRLIRTEIHFAGVCQDGVLAKIILYSNDHKLYETNEFGTTCSGGLTVGPEIVDKLIVTPRRVDVQSRFWY